MTARMEVNKVEMSTFGMHPLYPLAPLFHVSNSLCPIFLTNHSSQVLGAHCVLLLGLSTGCVSLLETTNKPFRGDAAVNVIKRFDEYLNNTQNQLESFGLKRGIVLFTAPSILVDVVTSGSTMIHDLATGTRSVIFAGAGLSDEFGEKLVEGGVDLINGYGL